MDSAAHQRMERTRAINAMKWRRQHARSTERVTAKVVVVFIKKGQCATRQRYAPALPPLRRVYATDSVHVETIRNHSNAKNIDVSPAPAAQLRAPRTTSARTASSVEATRVWS